VDRPSPYRLASILRWSIVAIITLAVLGGSLWPGASPASFEGFVRLPGGMIFVANAVSSAEKHVIAYGLLGFFLCLALRADSFQSVAVGTLLASLSISIELIQIPIPGRSFSWSDAAASTFGAFLGVASALFARWFIR